MKTIGITGGTGFIGRHLTELLVQNGYDVVVFTRSASKEATSHVSYAHWNPDKNECDTNALKNLDAVIHLAGAAVAEKRLTEQRKQEITGSRVKSTEFLLSQLKAYAPRCKTLVAASATGFYGPDRPGMAPFTEDAQPYDDFLGNTCRRWEAATQKADDFLRTVVIRIGIVLGKDGGAYPQLAGPLKFGIIPILGSGKQITSWIEVNDLARLFLFAIENDQLSGVYNGVTPNPVSHKELMKTIAKVKGGFKIPAPAPAFVLKIVLGEMADEVLKSCTVSGSKTVAAGFTFQYPDLVTTIIMLEGKK